MSFLLAIAINVIILLSFGVSQPVRARVRGSGRSRGALTQRRQTYELMPFEEMRAHLTVLSNSTTLHGVPIQSALRTLGVIVVRARGIACARANDDDGGQTVTATTVVAAFFANTGPLIVKKRWKQRARSVRATGRSDECDVDALRAGCAEPHAGGCEEGRGGRRRQVHGEAFEDAGAGIARVFFLVAWTARAAPATARVWP